MLHPCHSGTFLPPLIFPIDCQSPLSQPCLVEFSQYCCLIFTESMVFAGVSSSSRSVYSSKLSCCNQVISCCTAMEPSTPTHENNAFQFPPPVTPEHDHQSERA
ncbi:hypothetical protein IW261DRAFT_1610537 [Armillaria novae-zelandiae]|uniref:Uncharacterized protein n=1 Tax=Armillaria novae-zelandiae TaxID=153914 RepID=A0AA39U9V5_9AGAR|nr:hypothetical protein IW261DRAFT_1610537 [Armillaria novae-zelandiae]